MKLETVSDSGADNSQCRLAGSRKQTLIGRGREEVLIQTSAFGAIYSTLKSRDITLPTKVHLVKAVVFPVVMYGCESWTIKKAEH